MRFIYNIVKDDLIMNVIEHDIEQIANVLKLNSITRIKVDYKSMFQEIKHKT